MLLKKTMLDEEKLSTFDNKDSMKKALHDILEFLSEKTEEIGKVQTRSGVFRECN